AIFVPFFAPYGPTERVWTETLQPPGGTHIWGTDQNGGDIFSMTMWATRIDLEIAITVVAVSLAIGTLIGVAAGYFGGAVDEVIMRITDVFFAFPGLILAMAIVSALGGRNLDTITVALTLIWWPTYSRLVRGQVLIEREKLYVEAARSVGASDMRIMMTHILPNTIQPVIVQATLDMGRVLLTAAGLSFIGYGAEAGTAEWGLMIAQGQDHFTLYWLLFYPGMAMLLCALAFNFVGDGVRDIMDPKLRRR
ncbi:MAG: ABC transporter permease, partial [Promethearchaeota archaeon]